MNAWFRAVRTFHLRLVADAAPPFVCAGRGIAAASGFRVFPANRKNIRAPSKQTPKQRDFGLNGRASVDGASATDAGRQGAGGASSIVFRSQRFDFGDNRSALIVERLEARQELAEPIVRLCARGGACRRLCRQRTHLLADRPRNPEAAEACAAGRLERCRRGFRGER